MKYRLQFTKGKITKYIGHLDVLSLMSRAVTRAGLPVKYSEGFNPHPLIFFAAPLTLGYESIAEYCDIELEKTDTQEIMGKLNNCLPPDTQITHAAVLMENKSKTGAVYAASYEVILDRDIVQNDWASFLAQDEILTEKRSKRGIKTVDIKPLILRASYHERLHLTLLTGSENNLNPALFVKALYQYLQIEYSPFAIAYTRTEIYKKDGQDSLAPLLTKGV